MTELSQEECFAQQEQRISKIKANWQQLSENDWDEALLEQLYTKLRTFSSECAQNELNELNDAVFSIEVYLSSFIGLNTRPNDKQFAEIDHLIQSLKLDSVDKNTLETKQPSNYIYILDSEDNIDQKIVSDLENADFHIDLFPDADALTRAIDVLQPGAIILEFQSTSELTLIKRLTDASLIVLNGNDDLKNRLSLMQNGVALYLSEADSLQHTSERLLEFLKVTPNNNYRVLIVEDDESQAKFAASVLEKADIETRIVMSPFEVLDIMEAFHPDLLLMDIYMPEANGIELTSIIRDHNDFVATPIIFLSGEHDPDIQLDALSVGGDDFLTKPIKPKHLVKVVNLRIKRARHLANAIGLNPQQDASTGLFSKKHFYDRVLNAMDNRKTDQQLSIFCVKPDVIADIPREKLSPLFSQLGALLNTQLNAQDVTAQIEADSLVIFIKRDNSVDIVELANQLRHSVYGAHLDTGIADEKFSISIGVHYVDKKSRNPANSVSLASEACTQAILNGGNITLLSSNLENAEAIPDNQDISIEDQIQEALDNQEFQIQYQPLLELGGRQSDNYEILLFLKTHTSELMSFRDIKEYALKMGVQGSIDRWLVETALDTLKKRRENGIMGNIFLQQSVASMMDDTYPEWLRAQLREKQIVASGLILDFSLADVSKDLKGARRNFDALRELDIEICLSRFSDKEAAFKVLRYLHATYTNISERLLHAEQEVISRVIKEVHAANAKLIVSKMDDPRSIDLHWSAGADYLQGRFVQRPMDEMNYDFTQVVL